MSRRKRKKTIVLHERCYNVNYKNLTIERYYQDKKGGGFRDVIGGFKTRNELNGFVVDHIK